MFREVFVLCALVVCYITFARAQNMVGKGIWNVISLGKCPEDSMFKYKFDVTRRKVSRTEDGFTAYLNLDGTIDESFAVRIDVCKDAEGGCKPYQVLTDDSFISFVNKFAENNVRAAFTLAGLDPPEFPIAGGEYHIKDYVFDYTELPEDGPYGIFGTQAYLIKDQAEVGCIETMMEFKEKEEEGDDDDDDDS